MKSYCYSYPGGDKKKEKQQHVKSGVLISLDEVDDPYEAGKGKNEIS